MNQPTQPTGMLSPEQIKIAFDTYHNPPNDPYAMDEYDEAFARAIESLVSQAYEARIATLEYALRLILPLAKGYVHAHKDVKSNHILIELAETALQSPTNSPTPEHIFLNAGEERDPRTDHGAALLMISELNRKIAESLSPQPPIEAQGNAVKYCHKHDESEPDKAKFCKYCKALQPIVAQPAAQQQPEAKSGHRAFLHTNVGSEEITHLMPKNMDVTVTLNRAPQQPQSETVREAFEKWAKLTDLWLMREYGDERDYHSYRTDIAWKAWQAALQHDGGQEPVAQTMSEQQRKNWQFLVDKYDAGSGAAKVGAGGMAIEILRALLSAQAQPVPATPARPDSNVIADAPGNGAFPDSDVIDTPADHVPDSKKMMQEAALQELADLGQEMGIGYEDCIVKMSIEECLAFSDEWIRGATLHEGSRGWRVVCMLLANEVRRLRAAQPSTQIQGE